MILSSVYDLPGEFSSDESKLVFSSTSSLSLLPDPNGSIRDIYSLDVSNVQATGACCRIQRVTFAGDGQSGGPATNSDGSLVVFDSTASNFAADNNDSLYDVFVIETTDPPARRPLAGGQTLSVNAGEDLPITLYGFSPTEEPLLFELTQEPTHGTLQGTPPELIYTPAAEFSGEDLFRFQVSASGDTSVTAEVSISVQPNSDSPPEPVPEPMPDPVPAVILPAPIAAVLPGSRSVLSGRTATAFATVINTNAELLEGCSVGPPTDIAANFFYQTTDSGSNRVVGAPNTPAAIPPGGAQTFIFGFTPTGSLAPTEIALNFECTNSHAAAVIEGVNTLLLSGSETPAADIVALGATPTNDGVLSLPNVSGSAAFGVASVNLGSTASVVVTPDTGAANLPVTLTICETNPINAQCLSPPSSTVETSITTDATPTFSIFATANGPIAFDPANTRIRVRFLEAGVVRGSTSIAVRTQ